MNKNIDKIFMLLLASIAVIATATTGTAVFAQSSGNDDKTINTEELNVKKAEITDSTLILNIDSVKVDGGQLGEPGPPGPPGATGPPGEQGPAGPAGVDGVNGTDGQQGPQGETGVQGIQGVAGINGTDGQNGQDGQDGLNGTATLIVKAPDNLTVTCTFEAPNEITCDNEVIVEPEEPTEPQNITLADSFMSLFK